MIVVADSSPLFALVNVEHVSVLPRLFGAVMVPPEVLAELGEAKRPAPVRAFAAQPPPWMEVRSPRVLQAIPRLHAGEQAAISLASEVGATLLLIDEKDGRSVAAQRHIPITGTVGILERAAA